MIFNGVDSFSGFVSSKSGLDCCGGIVKFFIVLSGNLLFFLAFIVVLLLKDLLKLLPFTIVEDVFIRAF